MRRAPYRDRLATLAGALRTQAELRARDGWSRAQLEDEQRRRLDAVVRHAVARSAFYREHLGGTVAGGPVEVATLPPVTKPALMERFDAWVCDPRVRRADVERHLAALQGDELLHGEYRVMATGGSTGTRGVFLYGRAEWAELVAHFVRMMGTMGVTPRLPRRRIAAVTAPGPAHMTWRLSASIDVGLHRRLALAATDPLADLVARLNAFRPDVLVAYPSIAGLLADEQRDGRLRIAPAVVATTSELRTAATTARIEAAWGVRPYDVYGATDGLWGWTCEHGRLHLSEELTIVEVVDDEDRPVPDGTTGSRLLITSLVLRTQPVIRYEISDLIRLHPDPCPCGRPTRTVAAIEGRREDVLTLTGGDGAPVRVHPIALTAPLARLERVRQYQLALRPDGLHVLLVPHGDAADTAAEARAAVAGALAEAGAHGTPVHVEAVAAIERSGGGVGKARLVVA